MNPGRFTWSLLRVLVTIVTILAVVGALVYVGPTGASAVSSLEVTTMPRTGKHVYLTFDAGNAPDFTVEPILKLLADEDIPVTFFLTGKWVVAHPRAARSIGDSRQHLIASHSYTHPYMTQLTPDQRWHEMRRTEWAVRIVCGRSLVPLWRPPNGDTNGDVDRQMAGLGYRTIMWSRDSHDWPLDGSVNKESVLKHIGTVSDGDVIVCHLRNWATVEALRELIPQLKAQGFEFDTLAALVPPTAD